MLLRPALRFEVICNGSIVVAAFCDSKEAIGYAKNRTYANSRNKKNPRYFEVRDTEQGVCIWAP